MLQAILVIISVIAIGAGISFLPMQGRPDLQEEYNRKVLGKTNTNIILPMDTNKGGTNG